MRRFENFYNFECEIDGNKISGWFNSKKNVYWFQDSNGKKVEFPKNEFEKIVSDRIKKERLGLSEFNPAGTQVQEILTEIVKDAYCIS